MVSVRMRRERDRWRDLLEQNCEYGRNKGGERVRQDEGGVEVETDERRQSKRGINRSNNDIIGVLFQRFRSDVE